MKEKTINISEVEEGLTTAKDIINADGVFLVPKDTVINKNHLLKLQLYQINQITVYDIPKVTETYQRIEAVIETKQDQNIADTKDFRIFFSKYVSSVKTLEKEFTDMMQNKIVKQDELSNLINSFITRDTSNSKLFSYLCRVQTTDDTTFSHCMNVSILAGILGKWLRLSSKDIENLSIAGLLHDIGKTQLNPEILNKKEPLTKEELEYVKSHSTVGYKMVADAALDDGIKQAVLLHHERMNGSGYPLKLEWEKVHKYAKIISIVDIYDAITSERPYHKKHHPFEAIRILEEECYGLLETDYLYVFLENIAHNFLGNDVLLSTGEEAKIIFINAQSPSHPMVQTKSGKFIDLQTYNFIGITQFL